MSEPICATGCSTSPLSGLQRTGRARGVVEPAAGGPGSGVVRQSDQVEVSSVATYLSKLSQLPPIRRELVASVRAQIEAGTYETPEKIDAAIGELVRDLAD